MKPHLPEQMPSSLSVGVDTSRAIGLLTTEITFGIAFDGDADMTASVSYYALFFATADALIASEVLERGLDWRIAIVRTLELEGATTYSLTLKEKIIPVGATHIVVFSGNGLIGPNRMQQSLRLQDVGVTEEFFDGKKPPLHGPEAVSITVKDSDLRHRYLRLVVEITRSKSELAPVWAPIEYYLCVFSAEAAANGNDLLKNHPTWKLAAVPVVDTKSKTVLDPIDIAPTVTLNIPQQSNEELYVPLKLRQLMASRGLGFDGFICCYAGSGDPLANDFRLNFIGVSVPFSDSAIPTSAASSLHFVDNDGRGGVLSGNLTFRQAPTYPETVEDYEIHFGSAEKQTLGTLIGTVPRHNITEGDYRFDIDNVTIPDNAVYLMVLSMNEFVPRSGALRTTFVVRDYDASNAVHQFVVVSIVFVYDGDANSLLLDPAKSWASQDVGNALTSRASDSNYALIGLHKVELAKRAVDRQEYEMRFTVRVQDISFAQDLAAFVYMEKSITLDDAVSNFAPIMEIRAEIQEVIVGIVVSDLNIVVKEASATPVRLNLTLSERPHDGTTFLLLDSDETLENVVITPTFFAFTHLNWNQAQQLTVFAKKDHFAGGGSVFDVYYSLVDTSGTRFSTETVKTRVTVEDDDVVGISVNRNQPMIVLQVPQAQADSEHLAINLSSEPLYPVTVFIRSQDPKIASPVFEEVLIQRNKWNSTFHIDIRESVPNSANAVMRVPFFLTSQSEDAQYQNMQSDPIAIYVFPLPPQVLEVRFSANGAYVFVTFDKHTNMPNGGGWGRIKQPFACSTLLVNASSLFGGDSQNCAWQEEDRLQITLGRQAAVQPAAEELANADPRLDSECLIRRRQLPRWQSTLTFKEYYSADVFDANNALLFDSFIMASAITRQNATTLLELGLGLGLLTRGVNDVRSALFPDVPTPIISGQGVVGICDPLSLDLYSTPSSGGRDYVNIDWSIASLTRGRDRVDVVDITKALKAYQGSTRIFVEPEIFLVNEYRVIVRMTNFLCSTGYGSFDVEKRFNTPPMVKRNSAASQRVNREETIRMEIDASPPGCNFTMQNRALNFTWFGYQNVCREQSEPCGPQQNPKILLLRPYSLPLRDEPYNFVVSTSVFSAPWLSVNTSFQIHVVSRNVVADIMGGGDRTLLIGAAFALDASTSRNPNYNTGHLKFKWTCQGLLPNNEACTVVDPRYGAAREDQSILRIGAGWFDGIRSNAMLKFTVTVESDDESQGSNVDSASILVTLKEGTINGTVALRHAYKDNGFFFKSNRVNPSDRLVIESEIVFNGAVPHDYDTFQYELSSPQVDIADLSILTPLKGQGAGLCSSNINSHCIYFVLNPASLSSGREFTFHLDIKQITVPDAGYLSARSSISINVNGPPTGGTFSVSPTRGTTLATLFNMYAIYWTDDKEDLPLAFSFSTTTSTGLDVLRAFSSQSSIATTLPVGEGPNNTVSLVLTVRDNPGAGASAVRFVESILPSIDEVDHLVSSTLDKISDLLQESNMALALVTMRQTALLLNAAASTGTRRAAQRTSVPFPKQSKNNVSQVRSRSVLEAVATSTRGILTRQAKSARDKIYVEEETMSLQLSTIATITRGGQLDNATSIEALEYMSQVITDAFESSATTILNNGAKQATVDATSDLIGAGVLTSNNQIGFVLDILSKTGRITNGYLVSGEVSEERTSSRLAVSTRRVSTFIKNRLFLNNSVDAGQFELPRSSGSSVGTNLVNFDASPYEYADPAVNEGIASSITVLDLDQTASLDPVTSLNVLLPVSNANFQGKVNGTVSLGVIAAQNMTCVKGATKPMNLINITFECLDGNGVNMVNRTCDGLRNYVSDL
jgi:hypothetical protein